MITLTLTPEQFDLLRAAFIRGGMDQWIQWQMEHTNDGLPWPQENLFYDLKEILIAARRNQI